MTAYFWNVMNGRVIKKDTFLIHFKILKPKARFLREKKSRAPLNLLHFFITVFLMIGLLIKTKLPFYFCLLVTYHFIDPFTPLPCVLGYIFTFHRKLIILTGGGIESSVCANFQPYLVRETITDRCSPFWPLEYRMRSKMECRQRRIIHCIIRWL